MESNILAIVRKEVASSIVDKLVALRGYDYADDEQRSNAINNFAQLLKVNQEGVLFKSCLMLVQQISINQPFINQERLNEFIAECLTAPSRCKTPVIYGRAAQELEKLHRM
ncbi:hypothetical protein [Leptothoe kymatousa]|uniref:Uncharacterized protein n=1 Tax=Leptothoe kymatousa TAU-MAC 1615 TaxID=2364775 RepID=A0ABS5Y6W0_9CYAN|nr:hypothetical protein [Leptothoe kymatousa]MBT9313547.1 hypothetical protein [Leptothoe kymatousa TAU-MAC 1615]